MSGERALVPVEDIARRIHTVRGQRVMLDSDLASLYGVTTKRLNQQVHRNDDRFPGDFMFQLTAQEVENLKLQIAASRLGWGGRRKPHNAFTEHGTVMAAMVLNSPLAVQMSVFVVRAFLRLRRPALSAPSAAYLTRQMSSTPLVLCRFAFPSGSAIIPSTTIGLFQCPLPQARVVRMRPDRAS